MRPFKVKMCFILSLVFLIFLLPFTILAQDTTFKDLKQLDSIRGLSYRLAVDTCQSNFSTPKYSLGNQHLVSYLSRKTRNPEGLELIKGQLMVSFVVTETGQVEELNILKSPHPQVTEDIIIAISKVKEFEPARCNGDPIEVHIIYSARFTGEVQ